MSFRDAQTLRHRTDVQQRRELVHTLDKRIDSRKRDQKRRVKPSSHTLHHDARRLRETVAKIGTDMPLQFEIRDCFTIVDRGTVVTGDTVSGVAHVNDVVELTHNEWVIRTKIIGERIGSGGHTYGSRSRTAG